MVAGVGKVLANVLEDAQSHFARAAFDQQHVVDAEGAREAPEDIPHTLIIIGTGQKVTAAGTQKLAGAANKLRRTGGAVLERDAKGGVVGLRWERVLRGRGGGFGMLALGHGKSGLYVQWKS